MALVGRVVRPLSERVGAAASLANPQGKPWDIAIAGQLLMLAVSEERPFIRQTAPIRKDQQDVEAEPGEQSLTGWWLRSQESFHAGSGTLYQEDRVSTDPSNRFRDSMGVDVWTPGEISLLPTTTPLQTTASTSLLAQGQDGTTPVVYQASGSTLYRITETTSTGVTWGGSGTILALEVWDGYYFVADSTGIYRGTIAGGAGSKVWTLVGASTVFIKKAGGFTLALVDNVAYDLTSESGAPTLPSDARLLITLKETGWKWTAATAGPGDIRAAGHSNGQTAIWTFTPTLTSSGWTFQQATGLPRGEIVYSMKNYYSSLLALGTSKGVRFAAYGDAGQYTFGPLSYESRTAVRGLHVLNQYVYATDLLSDGLSGLVRINPETEVTSGRFAWANDVSVGTASTAKAVCDLNGRLVVAVDTGSYITHLTNLVTSGYLTTGRIRFRTLEPKLFKYVKLRTNAINGTIAVDAVTDTDSTAAVVTYSTEGEANLTEAQLPSVLGPQESIALRFTLAREVSDPTVGPVLRSYQVKALPAPKRQRIFQIPVSMYDIDRAYNGTTLGYYGYGRERIRALETAEETGDTVLYQDFHTGESRLVTIEQITYQQTSPPGRTPEGGFAQIVVKTVSGGS